MWHRDRDEVPVIRRQLNPHETDPNQGLTRDQVRIRQESGWTNDTQPNAGTTEKEIILRNCLTYFNLIFVVLAAMLAISGSSVKNMAFLLVVLCNVTIGVFQEIRAKRAVDQLNLVAEQQVRTLRQGKTITLPSRELVRDDIVEFRTGDQICADGVVRRGELHVNESLITGEADPIVKGVGDPLMSGSFVITGTALVQLTAVGQDSFASRLAAEAKRDPKVEKSEMMRALDGLIRVVGLLLIPIGAALLLQELLVLKLAFRESVESTVAALVGMIPEGLYLLTSVAMAVSARKLAKQKVLVRDMNCIETLARVDVLCVDKTGTITEPEMEVEDLVPLGGTSPEELEQLLGAMYHGQEPENDTARAMAETFDEATDWECVRRVGFSSATKWSGAEFAGKGSFVIGAPEFVLTSRYAELEQTIAPWQARGVRVLLIAAYEEALPDGWLHPELVHPLALALLTNRIRPEAVETFSYFAKQGVQIRVISGDNPVTVSEVAREAGIENADRYVDARTLETEEDIAQAVENYTVFGRVTPDRKKQLITALQDAGHTVAMTGDGVNDVLAMKQADCGIAMASGAQAASQVAQLVLLESDFSAMPQIVGEGRRVINNIQRAAALFLVKNIFSLVLAVITLFTRWHYPLIPLHLSVVSGLTIGVPSFFLALEPNYERVSGNFLAGVLRRALPGGLTNILVVLIAQAFMEIFGLPLAGVSPVCAAILAVVGLMVLYQVCKPFDKLRRIVWCAMAGVLLICFTLLRGIFELSTVSAKTTLVMVTLLCMAPTVFFGIGRFLDTLDEWLARAKWWLNRLRRKSDADL